MVATARNTAKIDDLKELGAVTIALDIVSSDEVVRQIIQEAIAIYGQIDILVNNAAYFLQGAVEECR